MLTDEFIINNILDKFWDDRIPQEELLRLTHKYWTRNVDEDEYNILKIRSATNESYEKIGEFIGMSRQLVHQKYTKACEKIRLDLYALTKNSIDF